MSAKSQTKIPVEIVFHAEKDQEEETMIHNFSSMDGALDFIRRQQKHPRVKSAKLKGQS